MAYSSIGGDGFKGDHRHDLLSQHIQWIARVESLFDFATLHAFNGGTAGQQVTAVLGEDDPLGRRIDLVP